MKDFIEKWNNDSKFKNSVQLGLYTLFVVIVSIFALSTSSNPPINTVDYNSDNNIDINEHNNVTIEIPEQYKYTKNITINEENYQYIGTKDNEKETISKILGEVSKNYIYENNNYYKDEEGSYILTTKEEVYDEVNFNYLNIETINQYLSKSTMKNDQYIVYLKDIILGNDSEEYITITLENNKINIDYSTLMQYFDESINNYLVEITIEEIE